MSGGKRRIVSDETQNRELYTIKIFKIGALKAKQRIIIDTPRVDYIVGSRFGTMLEVRESTAESFYRIKGHIEYTGVIISLFHKDKLIYQVTDSRKLKKSGLSELSPELIRKYSTERFVLANN